MRNLLFVVFLLTKTIYANGEVIECDGGQCDCLPTAPTPGETCILSCGDIDVCKGQILNCRAGDPCNIRCTGYSSCADHTQINANTATNVLIICDGIDACKVGIDIKCGTGHCTLECGTGTSCDVFGTIHVDMSSSFICNNCPGKASILQFTASPTINPAQKPTFNPTPAPTKYPTIHPTINPTMRPSNVPTNHPTKNPTNHPTTNYPSIHPTNHPTNSPTKEPTNDPTNEPTTDPTNDPTTDPTGTPSVDPTTNPTIYPTLPTIEPTFNPTMEPTMNTINPTNNPTILIETDKNDANLLLINAIILISCGLMCCGVFICCYVKSQTHIEWEKKEMQKLEGMAISIDHNKEKEDDEMSECTVSTIQFEGHIHTKTI